MPTSISELAGMTVSEVPYFELDREASSSKVYPPIVVPVPTLPFILRQVSLNAPDILAFSYAITTLAAALMLGMPGAWIICTSFARTVFAERGKCGEI